MTTSVQKSYEQLLEENENLRRRLEEPEATVDALRSGEVDAVVIHGPFGAEIYTLEGADRPYRLLIEAMQQGAATLDQKGNIVYCNRYFANLVQKNSEDMIGAAVQGLVTDQDQTLLSGLVQDAYQKQSVRYEVQLQRQDGSSFPAEIILHTLPYRGMLCLLVTDLTRQKQYEELLQSQSRLAESEQRLRAILDNTPALVYVVDADGRLLFINRRWEAVFGLTSDQVVGKSLEDFFPKDAVEQFRANNRRVLETRAAQEFEEIVRHADGLHTYLSVKVPLLDAAGTPDAICGISTDITERLQAEVALREADRRKDEFLALLGHELRNPLAPIRNAVQIMARQPLDNPDLQWARNILERQVKHLTRLVEDLLDVSRITRGKVKLHKEMVSLADIVHRALETSQPLIDEDRHQLTLSIPSEPIFLEADPTRLTQVVANVLNNAAKYTEPGGRIEVAAVRDGNEVTLRIRDSGIGIAPEKLPHIFDIFTQVDSSLGRSHGGLGIGLSLVHRLVEMHGGKVQAHSDGPGKGSEFVICLPCLSDAPPRKATSTSANAQRQPVSCRLLIVDDNKDAANTLAMLLNVYGHQTHVAYDGTQALKAAQAHHPDIILLDIGLPGMDGHEVARRLRALPGLENVTLIALTGYGQESDRRLSEAAGFNHHLVKPLDIEEMETLLASLALGRCE